MSTSFNNAPRKSHVQVAAAIPGRRYPQPDILPMKPDAVKELYYGFLVSIWIDRPNDTPLKLESVKPISILSLTAISPIIKDAIKANGPLHRDIDHITLPAGHPEAYELLFKWLDNTTTTGIHRHLAPEFDSPLFKYHHLLEVAENLKIASVTKNLRPRYETMLAYKKNSKWNIQSKDIYRVYREVQAGHPLRTAVVEGVALAWYYGDLGGGKRKVIERITWEVPELWEDLNGLWERFERDGV